MVKTCAEPVSEKRCCACAQVKLKSEFNLDKGASTGLQSRCKACANEYARQWALRNRERRLEYHRAYSAANTERARAYDRARQLRKYGLTPAAYEVMLDAQGGVCAICRSPEPGRYGVFCVDHDHQRDTVRGLLCNECNRGLGLFGDDVSRLREALAYLESYA